MPNVTGEDSSPRATTRSPNGRAWFFVGAFTLFLSLSFFVPWQPSFIRTTALDDSWILALNATFARHAQFGRDIVFTFGPWGFLNPRCYFPQTYPMLLIAWGFMAVVFWRVCWVICRQNMANPISGLIWLTLTLGVAAMTLVGQTASPWCLVSLLLVYYFHTRWREFPLTTLLLLAGVALASLIKFTYFAAAVLVLAPITIDQLRQRRVPSVALGFIGCFLGLYLLAGQRIEFLWSYLRLTAQVAGRYTDAMSLACESDAAGPVHAGAPVDLAVFVLGAMLLVVALAVVRWDRKNPWASILPALAGAGLLFTFGKWGWVRHDLAHTPLSATALLCLALACLPVLRTAAAGHLNRRCVAVFGAAAAAGCATVVAALGGQNLAATFGASLLAQVRPNAQCAFRLATGNSTLPGDYQRALADIRKYAPMPEIHGTMDVYPWNQSLAVAYGMTYRPRPIFQSYSAYSPELARLNAAHLRGADAPDTVLFSVVDHTSALQRFPSEDDGPSWPELLTRYEIHGASGGFLLLEKLKEPRAFSLRSIQTVSVAMDQPLAVPSMEGGPIWVRIGAEPTLEGRALSVAYKSPELWMKVTTRDGRSASYRLAPGAAEAGFVLSPVVSSARQFASLESGDWRMKLRDHEVVTLTLSLNGWLGQDWAYQPRATVEFSRLRFPTAAPATVLAGLDDLPRD